MKNFLQKVSLFSTVTGGVLVVENQQNVAEAYRGSKNDDVFGLKRDDRDFDERANDAISSY